MSEASKVDRKKQERAADQAREKIKPKGEKSEFDKVVDRQRVSQPASITKTQQEDATREGVKEFARKMEKSHERKTEKKEKKEKSEQDGDSRKKTDAKIAEHKVVGKGTTKHGHGGAGGDSQGGFAGSRRGKKGLDLKLSKAGAKGLPVDLKSKFAAKLKATMGTDQARMSQEIIDKLVQYVKIGLNRKGEKEIQIDLHEKIYRGLKLKVTSKGKGKVSVHLLTSNAEAKSVFKRESGDIKSALAKKGIEVEEILVS